MQADHARAMIQSRRVASLALLLIATGTAVAAQSDRLDRRATGWGYRYNASPSDLASVINAGFRLIDLDVRSSDPLRFDAAYVSSPGAYHYYLDVADPATILTLASQNGARPVDIERYLVNDTPRWTVIMNVSDRGYIFRVDETFASLVAWVGANPGWRMIDIERSQEGSTFHTLFYPNEGVDYAPWYWLVGVTGQALLDFANANDARVFDIERIGPDSFDALLVGDSAGVGWYVLAEQSSPDLSTVAKGMGTRIVDIDYYSGTDSSTVVLLENSLLFTDGFESGDTTAW